jgi:hypothetical protein
MSQVGTSLDPGWRPDPSGRYEWRYWDGGWTNRVANSGTAAAPPAPVPAPAPAPPAPDAPPPVPAATAPDVTPESAAPSPVAPEAVAPEAVAPEAVARVEPFGVATTTPTPAEPQPVRARRRPWARFVSFIRSFADQPESYHSAQGREPVPAEERNESMMTAAPGNYGFAGITALAACGIVGGAYLPWLSGTLGVATFHRSGFDQGLGLGYAIGATALAISALLSVHMRIFKWLTIVLAFVLAGFVARDLLNTYDAMQTMNAARSVDANVGMGLWVMIVAAAVAMIASVRLSEDQKIG